jgi:peptidoglycan/LPS O-acetylase OafA/YrhL
VHWLVFEILWWTFDALSLMPGSLAGWAFFFVLILVSLAAAFVLHHLVERPARRALRRLAEGVPSR